jgi:uncharacterized membrane protein HdeD (DUF308 family)
MSASLKKTIAAALAALTLGLSVASPTPASAHYWRHGWGPGIAFGVLGLAAGAIVASQYECTRYRPVYDAYGRYVGQQPVNVC